MADGLKPKAEELLDLHAEDPFQRPPPFEKLVGDLAGACSRRINIHPWIVNRLLEQKHGIKILRLWAHYE